MLARGYRLKRFKYNSHYWIFRLVDDAKRPQGIFDVGSADRCLGALLKERGTLSPE